MCALSRPTLCDLMDCNSTGSSDHGIVQARILERIASSSSRGSTWPRNQTRGSWVSCVGRWILYHRATRQALPEINEGERKLQDFGFLDSRIPKSLPPFQFFSEIVHQNKKVQPGRDRHRMQKIGDPMKRRSKEKNSGKWGREIPRWQLWWGPQGRLQEGPFHSI